MSARKHGDAQSRLKRGGLCRNSFHGLAWAFWVMYPRVGPVDGVLLKKENTPDPVDIHVGRRLRLRREILRLSQEQVANGCDFSTDTEV